MANKPTSQVAKTLKRLRERAGLSMPEMASELGMKTSTYQHYEDRYKKENLPPDLAVRVAVILRKAGIGDDELAELGAAAVQHENKLDLILNELRELRARIDAVSGATPPGESGSGHG